MRVTDLFLQLTHDVLPIAVPLCIVAAAAVLWRRTRRVSVLVQLVAALLILYGISVDRFGRHSDGLHAVLSENMRISMDVALVFGFVLFPLSYLVYALRQTRI